MKLTLLEMIDEVYEKTHVDKLEIYSRATRAWPLHETFTQTQCKLLEQSLRGATPEPKPPVSIIRG